jgi:hypothetical protein
LFLAHLPPGWNFFVVESKTVKGPAVEKLCMDTPTPTQCSLFPGSLSTFLSVTLNPDELSYVKFPWLLRLMLFPHLLL